MKKFLKGLLAVVIILIIAGFIFYQDVPFLQNMITGKKSLKVEEAASSTGPGSGQALKVVGVVVQPQTMVDKLEVTGELIPNEYVELKSEISGLLESIFFDEGQYVRKGAVLAKINVDELLAEKEKLEYTTKLRESVELRQRKLLEREAISQEEYEQALTELQTSSADIHLIETQIEKSEIKAPFSGIMGLREVSEGAYLTSSTVIAPLYSINPAKLEFSIPGKYSNMVKIGKTVNFQIESSVRTHSGKIYVIEPRVDPNTRTIKLRALCPNPSNQLLPGQFARVELVMDSKENALMVPTQAVIPELGGSKLFLSKSGKAVSTQVQTGFRTDTDLEILDAVAPGDTVITTGILQLRPGMTVEVTIQD